MLLSGSGLGGTMLFGSGEGKIFPDTYLVRSLAMWIMPIARALPVEPNPISTPLHHYEAI